LKREEQRERERERERERRILLSTISKFVPYLLVIIKRERERNGIYS